MKVKILLGSIRTDKGVVKSGEILEANEADAKEWIRLGVVEEVKDKPIKMREKKEEKPEKEKPPKPKEEVVKAQPSLDWTKSELIEYAKSIGIPIDSNSDKKTILNAIRS